MSHDFLSVPGPFINTASNFRLKFQAFICEGFILSKVPGFLDLVKLSVLPCNRFPF